ncbi:hypothetical protein LR48_Vigan07g131300 [Vigna angularis]|uniref:Uncharacterized protein n=1 Tax=Phaseolus angularis TaxID=3914 RepID=A0A0L9UYJ3_PHAAN|nr:hypothetical protein LR48_Vigan07g131300 [Vigna angularis]
MMLQCFSEWRWTPAKTVEVCPPTVAFFPIERVVAAIVVVVDSQIVRQLAKIDFDPCLSEVPTNGIFVEERRQVSQFHHSVVDWPEEQTQGSRAGAAEASTMEEDEVDDDDDGFEDAEDNEEEEDTDNNTS